ncbi:MAG: DUF192 domain-containing protein [Bdellovibrionota bacterium]
MLLEKCRVTTNAFERMYGLLPRKSLEPGEALWIKPTTSIHTFFMRFTIDVAFLDRAGKVIRVYSHLKPWRHSRIHFFAAGAIEAGAGALAGVQEGEVLEICLTS